MNYEKAYKEALERAKELRRQVNANETILVNSDLDTIFPELRESEDERIRKAIHNALKYLETEHSWDFLDDVDILDAYSWLEKQGEKVDVIENFDTEFEKQVSHLLASVLSKEYEYTEDFVKWVSNSLLGYAKHEIEKQGEKEPIEQDTEIRDLWEYIQEWREKFGRLPKDADELADCIYYVIKRQKPIAWSEEDERNLKEVITHVRGYQRIVNPANETGESDLTEWLKSLKPNHWKPSEEQLKALAEWLKNHQFDGDSRYIYPIFQSLYNNLKNL